MALTWEQSDLLDSVMIGSKDGERVCIITTFHRALGTRHMFSLLGDDDSVEFKSYDRALDFAEELFD